MRPKKGLFIRSVFSERVVLFDTFNTGYKLVGRVVRPGYKFKGLYECKLWVGLEGHSQLEVSR